jgi:hypothetical protein
MITAFSRMKRLLIASLCVSMTCLGVLIPWVGAAPVPAGDLAKLKIIPASAGAVVVIRGVEGVKGRLFEMLKKALPDYAPMAQTIVDLSLGSGIDGRKIDSLAKDGPIYLAVQGIKEKDFDADNPNLTVIASVKDYAKFRDGILKPEERKDLTKDGNLDVIKTGKRVYFMAEKDGFAIIAPSKEGVEWVLKSKESLDGKVSPALSSRLAAADLALFVNLDQALKEYAEQLKDTEASAVDFLKSAAEALPQEQKASFELMQTMVKPAFQSLRDSSGVVVSLGIAPDGALLRFEVEARKGTETAKFINSVGVSPLEALGNLPAGQMFYSGFVGGEAMTKMMETFSKGLVQDGKNEEIKKLLEATKAVAKAGPGDTVTSVDMPLAGLGITQYKDPSLAIEAQIKTLELMGPGALYGSGAVKSSKVTKDAVTHDGIKFTKVEVIWDFDKMFGNSQDLPEEVKKQVLNMMKELMGEKMEVYSGISDGKLIQITTSSAEKAKKIYDAHKSGNSKISSIENYGVVRRGLSERQTMVFLTDPVRYFGKVIEVMKGAFAGMVPIPPGFPANLDKAKPNYIGGGVILEQNNAAMEFYVSSASINEIFKTFVKPFLNQQ